MKSEDMHDRHMCNMGHCSKCHSWKLLIVGIIIAINAWWPFIGWWKLVAVLLIIAGLSKLFMPRCSHCK
ncbi:MAG: hypothetical protein AABW73_01100 [Nanoarchaeota archaeon]